MVKKGFNKLTTILLSLLLLINNSSYLVYADESDNSGETTIETPQETYTEDSEEVTESSDKEEPVITEDTTTQDEEVVSDDEQESTPADGEETTLEVELSPIKQIENLINQLPSVDQIGSLSEEELDKVYTLMSQIEDIAEVNEIDLTQYETYLAIYNYNPEDPDENINNDINLIDENGTVEVSNETDLKTQLESESTTTVKLTSDITISNSITVNGSKTLDLNGKTISYKGSGNDYQAFKIASDKSFTIADSSNEKGGTISTTNAHAIYTDNSASNCTLIIKDGVTLTSNYTSTGSNNDVIALKADQSNVTIEDGNIIARGTDGRGIIVWDVSSNSTINIKNGNLSSALDTIFNNNASTSVNIEGGTFSNGSASSYIINNQQTTRVNISAGNFNSFSDTSIVKSTNIVEVTGGKYSNNTNLSKIVKHGYAISEINEDPYKYEVKERLEASVTIGDETKTYKTLSEAIDAVNELEDTTSNVTIKLLMDSSSSTPFTINKDATLDLNNHTFTYSGGVNTTAFSINSNLTLTDSTITDNKSKGGSIVNSNNGTNSYMFTVNSNGSLNINNININMPAGSVVTAKDNTTVNISNTKIDLSGSGGILAIIGSESVATLGEGNEFKDTNASANNIIQASNGAKLIVNGGDYYLQSSNVQNASLVYLDRGELTVNNGKFEASVYGATIYASSANSNITINGGEFINNRSTSPSLNGNSSPVVINGGYFKAIGSGSAIDFSYQQKYVNGAYEYNVKLYGGRFYSRGNVSSSSKMNTLDYIASFTNKTVKTLNASDITDGYTNYLYEIGDAVASVTVNGTTYKYGSLNDAIKASVVSATAAKPLTITLLSYTKEDLTLNKQYISIDTNGKKIDGTVTISANNTEITGTGSINKVSVTNGVKSNISNGDIGDLETTGTGTFSITGGTYGSDPSAYVDTNFYNVIENADNGKTTYTIKIKDEVTVSDFEKFKLAMESKNVTKVTVSGNITMTSDVNAVGTKDLIVDSGKTITNWTTVSNSRVGYSINVGDEDNTANITLNGEGTISANYKEAFNVNPNSTLNIKSGTIKTQYTYGSAYSLSVNGGNLNVSGGTITSSVAAPSTGSGVVYIAKGSKVNITGGTIEADNTKASYREGIVVDNNAGSGDTSVNISGGFIGAYTNQPDVAYVGANTDNSVVNITGGTFRHWFTEQTGTYFNANKLLNDDYITKDLGSANASGYRYEVVTKYEVEVKDSSGNVTQYTSLKEALSNATDGSTVTLLRDQLDNNYDTCTVSANNITLDLNGYTANINQNPINVTGSLTIKDSKGTGAINASTIYTKSSTSVNYDTTCLTNLFEVTGTLTLESGTLTQYYNSKNVGSTVESLKTVNVKDGGTFNIKGGTVGVGEYGSTAYAIYASGSNTSVNFTGGSVDALTYGVYIGNGANLDMSDGTIKYTAYALTLDNATANLTGENISFDEKTQYCFKIIEVKNGSTLNVSGGTYVSRGSYSGSNYGYPLYVSNSNVNISGGIFQTSSKAALWTNDGTGKQSEINISGGNFHAASNSAIVSYSSKVTVTGGTFAQGANYNNTYNICANGDNDYKSNVTIYGGRFSNTYGLYQKSASVNKVLKELADGYTYHSEFVNNVQWFVVGPASAKFKSIDENGNEYEFATLEEAINLSSEGSTIKLVDDYNLDLSSDLPTLDINKDITIDLNGHTLNINKSDSNSDSAISVNEGINLIVTDTSDNKNGKLTSDTNTITTDSNSTVTINAGNVESSLGHGLIVKGEGTKVTLNDGSIKVTGDNSNAIFVDDSASSAEVIINDGTLSSSKSNVVAGGTNNNNNSVTINNGTFSNDGNTNLLDDTNYNLTINNGKFDSGKDNVTYGVISSDSNASINGGEYSTKTNVEDKLNNNYSLVENTNDDRDTYPYIISSKAEAVLTGSDGNVKATGTLSDLINQASAGDTVTLKNDVATTSTVTINKDITLDLGGNKLTSTGTDSTVTINGGNSVTIKNGTIEDSTGEKGVNASITVKKDAKLTLGNGKDGLTTPTTTVGKIINEGTLDITKGATTGEIKEETGSTTNVNGGSVTGDSGNSITGETGSNTNINDGNTGDIKTDGNTNVTGGNTGNITTGGNGNTNIAGGNVEGLNNGSTGDSNITGGNVGDVDTGTGSTTNISGGNFTGNVGGDGTNKITGGTFTNKPEGIEDGYVPVESIDNNGNTIYTVVKEENAVVTITNNDGSIRYFDSLDNAVDLANSNDTLTLKKDLSVNDVDINKSLTIDLNGKTITGNGTSSAFNVNSGEKINVTIKGTGSVTNGKDLINSVSTIDFAGANKGSTLTIDNATIKGSNGADNTSGDGYKGSYAIEAGDNNVVLVNNASVIGGDGGSATGESGKGGKGSDPISPSNSNVTQDSGCTLEVGKDGKDALSNDLYEWTNKYKDVIDKDTVTDEDLTNDSETGIDDAIEAYNAITSDKSAVKDIYDELVNKKKAADWYKDTNTDTTDNSGNVIPSAIKDDSISLDDVDKINDAYNSLEKLTEEEKQYLDKDVVKDIKDKKSAVDFLTDEKWKDVLEKDNKGQTLTEDDYKKLEEAKTKLNELDESVKQLIDEGIKDLINDSNIGVLKASLETYKKEAIEEVTNKSTSANSIIDGLTNLTKDQVNDYKNRISGDNNNDSALAKATSNIESVNLDTTATDLNKALKEAKDLVDSSKNSGIDEIEKILEEAKLANDKAKAISDLDSYVTNQKKNIDDYVKDSLTNEKKKEIKDSIDKKVSEIESDINNNASTSDEVNDIYNSGIADIDKIIDDAGATSDKAIETKKANAIAELNKEAQQAKDAVSGLSDEDKSAYEKNIDDARDAAIKAITEDDSHTLSAINDLLYDGVNKINTIKNTTKAIKELEDYADSKKAEIDKLQGLNSDQKTTAKSAIEKEVETGKTNISKDTNTTDDINNALSNAENAIDVIVNTNTSTSDKNIAELKEAVTDKADEVTEKIKALGLTDEKTYLDKVTNVEDTAISNIDSATDLDSATSVKDKALTDLDAILNRASAISELKTYADTQIATINALTGLSDSQKNTYITKINNELTSGTKAITSATSDTGVDNALNDSKAKMDKIASDANIDDIKAKAIKELEEHEANLEKEVDKLIGLTTAQKQEAKQALNAELGSDKNLINSASDASSVQKAKDASKIELNKILDSYKNISKETIDSIKEELANKAEETNSKIEDLSNLDDAKKKSYEDRIDSLDDDANTSIDSATDLDTILTIKEDTLNAYKDILEEANVDNDKLKAIEDLNKYVDTQIENINSLTDVTEDDKTNAINSIKEKAKTTEDNINSDETNTRDKVSEAYDNGIKDIDEVIKSLETASDKLIETKKEEANTALEDKANKAKEEIDNLDNLTEDQKTSYKDKIDSLVDEAKKDINTATSIDDINDKLTDTSSKIDEVKDLANKADKAIEELKNYALTKKEEIDALAGLTDALKENAKSVIDKEVDSGSNMIVKAGDEASINNNLEASKKNIDDIVDNYKKISDKAIKAIEDEIDAKAKEIIKKINNLSNLEDKQSYIDEVNSTIASAKEEISNSDNIELSKIIKDNALSSLDSILDNASIANDKAKAIDELNKYVQEQSSNIDKLTDVSESDRNKAKEDIADIANKAIASITNANTSTDVTNLYNEAIKNIDSVIDGLNTTSSELLDTKKNEAKNSIEDKANKAIEEIDKLDNLTYDQKKDYKDEINNAKDEAIKNIDEGKSLSEVNNAKDKANSNIDSIVSKASSLDTLIDDLNKYAETKKSEIDSLPGLTDEQKDAAKAEINIEVNKGKEAISSANEKQEADAALDTSKKAIDSIVDKYAKTSNEAINSIKKELEDKATETSKEINALSNLSDQDKKTYEDKISEAIKDSDNGINNAGSLREIKSIKDATKSTLDEIINEAKLTNDKTKASDDLDSYIKSQEENINKLTGLTEEEKAKVIDDIKAKANEVKDNINDSLSSDEVSDNYNEGFKEIDKIIEDAGATSDAIIATKKDEANKSLEDKANKAIEEVNNLPGLTDSQKKDYVEQINKALEEAKKDVDEASKLSDINDSLTDGNQTIDSIKDKAKESSDNVINKARENAKKAIEDNANDAIATIDALKNLDEATKQEYINKINEKKDEANYQIDNETSLDNINSIKEETNRYIDKIEASATLDDIKTGKNKLIDKLAGLDDDEKESYKEIVNKKIDDAKNLLDTATSADDISKIIEDAKSDVDATVTEARELSKKHIKEQGTVTNTTEAAKNANSTMLDNTAQSDLENKLLSDEEIANVDNGDKSYEVWLEVTDVTTSTSYSDVVNKEKADEEIKSIEDSLSGSDKKLGKEVIYLDVSLFKQEKGNPDTKTQITGTSGSVTISMLIPSNMVNTDSSISREYWIIRTHKLSTGTIVTERIKANTISRNAIKFDTDQFSTYALIYIDTPVKNTNDGGNNNNGSDSNNSTNNKGCKDENWVWSEAKGACVYKVRNTGSK